MIILPKEDIRVPMDSLVGLNGYGARITTGFQNEIRTKLVYMNREGWRSRKTLLNTENHLWEIHTVTRLTHDGQYFNGFFKISRTTQNPSFKSVVLNQWSLEAQVVREAILISYDESTRRYATRRYNKPLLHLLPPDHWWSMARQQFCLWSVINKELRTTALNP